MNILNRINNLLDATQQYKSNPYFVMPHYKKPSKTYENKDANVEYYTDEKGNIRRRKINKIS